MTEHTPTTAEVRAAYVEAGEDLTAWVLSGADHLPTREAVKAEFDRWLNTVRAEAWDEGWNACASAQPVNPVGYSNPDESPNPYRKEEN